MKILRFEDLAAWRAAREMTRQAFRASDVQGLDADLFLRRQLRRAATSAMANIAEGFQSGSDREFARFLRIARRSATEVQSHLYVASDRGCIKKEVFDAIYQKCEDTKNLIGGFLRYLKTPRKPGVGPSNVKT